MKLDKTQMEQMTENSMFAAPAKKKIELSHGSRSIVGMKWTPLNIRCFKIKLNSNILYKSPKSIRRLK